MIEYITLALLVYIAIQDYLNRKERDKLIEAFLAKNLKELYEKPQAIKNAFKVNPEVEAIPISEATDEEFEKAIKKELGKEPIIEKVLSKFKRK